jgi:scyllo-inositol 2-dehydrogenase (NADP+)
LLKYDHRSVHLKGGYYFREAPVGYALHGTKGSFLKSRGDVQEDQLQDGMTPDNHHYGFEPKSENGLLHTELEGLVFRKEITTYQGNYSHYYAGVADAIINKNPAPVTAQDGVNVMKIIDAVFESHETGKMITLK